MAVIRIRESRHNEICVSIRVRDHRFESLIESLKRNIPAYQRSFDVYGKQWMVSRGAERQLLCWTRWARETLRVRIVSEIGSDERDKRERPREPRDNAGLFDPYRTLCLTPDAPIEVVRAARKALSLLYHPDRPNGDLGKMQAINSAVDQIEKVRAN